MTKRPKPWEVPNYTFQVPSWPPRFESRLAPSKLEVSRLEAARKNAAHHAAKAKLAAPDAK